MNEEQEVTNEARTEWVAPTNTFDVQNHDWLQTNAVEIRCDTCPKAHGSSIRMGKTLVGSRGNWSFIDTPIAR